MKRNGFSLIEVLIVLGIIGTLAIFAVSRPQNLQKDYARFYRRFSLFSKKIRNQAMLENATYRMVIYLEPESPPSLWVEKGTGQVLLGNEKESKEEFKKILEDFKKSKTKRADSDEKKKAQEGAFKKSVRFDFEKLKMPPSLLIKQVEVSGIEYEIDEGVAVFHYFPQGLVEEASIQFTNQNDSLKATLVTESISGEVFKINGHQRLKDLQERK